MVKRHQSLVPVAREHHEYLILARRLMLAGTKPDDNWPAEPAARAQAIAGSFGPGLWHHFAVEEEVVFQAAATLGTEAATLVTRLISEHRRIEELAAQMRSGAMGDTAALAAFGLLLNDHIRFEDRGLFPLLEGELSSEALLRLQADIEARYG